MTSQQSFIWINMFKIKIFTDLKCNLYLYSILWKRPHKPGVMAWQAYDYRIQYKKHKISIFSIKCSIYTILSFWSIRRWYIYIYIFLPCEICFISTSHIRIHSHPIQNIQIPTWPIAKVQYCIGKPYMRPCVYMYIIHTNISASACTHQLQQQSIKIFLV